MRFLLPPSIEFTKKRGAVANSSFLISHFSFIFCTFAPDNQNTTKKMDDYPADNYNV